MRTPPKELNEKDELKKKEQKYNFEEEGLFEGYWAARFFHGTRCLSKGDGAKWSLVGDGFVTFLVVRRRNGVLFQRAYQIFKRL